MQTYIPYTVYARNVRVHTHACWGGVFFNLISYHVPTPVYFLQQQKHK